MPLWFSELDRQQLHYYNQALASSHEAHTYCELWNRGRRLERTLDDKAFPIDGQVDLQGTSRSATCAVFDSDNYLKLDSNLLFLKRVLRVERWIRVTELDDFVRVPAHTGPTVMVVENAGTVTIEAHGFEEWLSGVQREIHRWPKGTNTVALIRRLLFIGGLAPKYQSIPDGPWRIPDSFQIGPKYEGGIWAAVTYLAQTINCDIFFDGAGICVLQHRPAGVTHVFTGGDGGTAIGVPQRSVLLGGPNGGDATALVNDCVVWGVAKPVKPPENPPPGYKPPKLPVIRGEAVAKYGTRFGPDQLGFEGTDFFARDEVTLEHVRLNRTAQAIAEERLRRRLSTAVQATFDAVPVPHLNPFDRLRIDLEPYYQGTVINTNFSLPFNFTADQPMTVGYNARVHVAEPRHRT